MTLRFAAALALGSALAGNPARADVKADYLELVEQGWNYAYRVSARGNGGALPPAYVMARAMAPRAVCLIGDPPHPVMTETLEQFRNLVHDIFGIVGPISTGRKILQRCDTGETIFIRFYATYVPNDLFNEDIRTLNDRFDLGLSGRQYLRIVSPGQAMTLFGHAGQITHVTLMEPPNRRISALERDFYRSILIEELYQSYSFGIDIFKMEHRTPFLSKLQESPANLSFLDWTSDDYMTGLLQSNPQGLCHFDAMMLHALAAYPSHDAEPATITDYVAQNFETLYEKARATAARADFADLFDPDCGTANPL